MIASLVLAVTHKMTEPAIDRQSLHEEKLALEAILPGVDSFNEKKLGDISYYEAYENGKFIAYCLKLSGKGYGGFIHIIVAIDKNGTIQGVEILEQHETPGLGDGIDKIKSGENEPYFLKQFKGKNAKTVSLSDIDAVTGATISSKAVVMAIHDGVNEFLKKIK